MVPHLRQYYNNNFTDEKYRLFLKRLDATCGTHVEFRVSETPFFIPAPLMNEMAEAGSSIIMQLM
ncbi:hypothetical protein FBQ87_06955, partial [Sphingobacteriales bacterium CHB3]|nr:hypothetical protein [Sphingobacteriales bacterium CHB3]